MKSRVASLRTCPHAQVRAQQALQATDLANQLFSSALTRAATNPYTYCRSSSYELRVIEYYNSQAPSLLSHKIIATPSDKGPITIVWLQKQNHLEGESEEYSNLVAEYGDTMKGLVRRMENAYSRAKGLPSAV